MVRVVTFLADKPFDVHDTTFSVSSSLFKVKKAVEVLSKVVLHHWQRNFGQ